MHEQPSFDFNPFGGLTATEIKRLIVPKFDLEELATSIANNEFDVIEFVGDYGRGKTTHLIALHQYLKKAPFHFLTKANPQIQVEDQPIVFIDSIGHVPFFKRIQLWKNKKTRFVYTTHHSRKMELNLFKRKIKSYYFKGLEAPVLQEIIRKRLALVNLEDEEIIQEIPNLLKDYGDDVRGIMIHLYEKLNAQEMQ